MKVNEKWCVFTKNEDLILMDLYHVLSLERSLRNKGVPYRTIYYRDNEPVRYVMGQGYKVMTGEEKKAIIESVKPSERIQCANCGDDITNHEVLYRAGTNGTIYCSKQCAYEAYEGLYTRKEVDQTMTKKKNINSKKPKSENVVSLHDEEKDFVCHDADSVLEIAKILEAAVTKEPPYRMEIQDSKGTRSFEASREELLDHYMNWAIEELYTLIEVEESLELVKQEKR